MRPRLKHWSLYLAVFALNMCIGYLFSLAYPLGILNLEEPSYWGPVNEFGFLRRNGSDWIRTPVFGSILKASTIFPEPTVALFWLNMTLLSLAMALVAVLGTELFKSRKTGALLGVSLIIFEVLAMHLYFETVQVCADALFADLILIGAVSTLTGCLKRSPAFYMSGFLALGLSASTKPIGIIFFFIFIPLAVVTALYELKFRRYRAVAVAIVSVVLLTGPVSIWTIRNHIVYGYAKLVGSGGFALFQATIPLLTDTDKIFDDWNVNREFIASVRKFEKIRKIVHPKNPTPWERVNNYEEWIPMVPNGVPGPFEFVADMTKGQFTHPGSVPWGNTQHMFAIEQEFRRISLRIMQHHPFSYFKVVLREYLDLFSPMANEPAAYDSFRMDPVESYTDKSIGLTNKGLFKNERGLPDGSRANRTVGKAFGNFRMSFPLGFLVYCFKAIEAIVVHLIVLSSLCVYLKSWNKKSSLYGSQDLRRICTCIIFLFAIAAVHNLAAALVIIGKLRYVIACDAVVHLMVLIALFACIRPAWKWMLSVLPLSIIELSRQNVLSAKIEIKPSAITWFAASIPLSVSMFWCWVLSLAFPFGFINSQTTNAFYQIKGFTLLGSAASYDWKETVLFGCLLLASELLSNPSSAVYWTNASLFSANIVLLFVLGRRLFGTNWMGLALSLSVLLLEIIVMHSFYFNLQMSPEATYGNLLLLGVLLGVIGWLRNSTPLFAVGIGVLGLTALIKPLEGMSVFLVWLPLIVCAVSEAGRFAGRRITIGLLLVSLLTGPTLLWSGRNLLVYGSFSPACYAEFSLLARALPLLEDKDPVFNTPEDSRAFVRVVRAYEKKVGFPHGGVQSEGTRLWIHDNYISWNRSNYSVYDYLASTIGRDRADGSDSQLMFELKDVERRIALSIMSCHFSSFVRVWLEDYQKLFSSAVYRAPSEKFQSNQAHAYEETLRSPVTGYPSHSRLNLFACNPVAVCILFLLAEFSLSQMAGELFTSLQFFLSHLIFIASLIGFALTLHLKSRFYQSRQAKEICLVTVVMFLTAAIDFMVVSACDLPRYRYVVAGDMLVHIVVLTATLLVTRRLIGSRPLVFLERLKNWTIWPSSIKACAEKSREGIATLSENREVYVKITASPPSIEVENF